MGVMGASPIDWESYFRASIGNISIEEIRIPDDVTSLSGYCMRGTNVQRIIIPDSVRTIGNYGLYIAGSHLVCVFESVNPPSINYNSTFNNSMVTIYVPDEAVDTYKANTGFRNLVNAIHPISELGGVILDYQAFSGFSAERRAA